MILPTSKIFFFRWSQLWPFLLSNNVEEFPISFFFFDNRGCWLEELTLWAFTKWIIPFFEILHFNFNFVRPCQTTHSINRSTVKLGYGELVIINLVIMNLVIMNLVIMNLVIMNLVIINLVIINLVIMNLVIMNLVIMNLVIMNFLF